MQIAIADIQQIFSKYNALCFDSKLPIPKIKLGNAKNYLGQLRFKRKKKPHGKWLYYDFCICINTRYEIDRQKLEDVVIHEMIHYYIHYNGIADTSSHGVVFRKMMEDINTRFGRNIIQTPTRWKTSSPPLTTNRHRLSVPLKDTFV